MAAAIEVTGIRELNKALRNVGDDFEHLKDPNKLLGHLVASRATALVPVRSGKLQSYIKTNPAKNKVTISAGRASVPYAGVIEYGWGKRGIRARPYLNKAVNEKKGEIKKKYEENIKNIIKKYNLD